MWFNSDVSNINGQDCGSYNWELTAWDGNALNIDVYTVDTIGLKLEVQSDNPAFAGTHQLLLKVSYT